MKLLLLFVKSECSSLFIVHKPDRLLESFVGVVGVEELRENTDFQSHHSLTESEFL